MLIPSTAHTLKSLHQARNCSHRPGSRNKRRHTKEMPDSKINDVNQNWNEKELEKRDGRDCDFPVADFFLFEHFCNPLRVEVKKLRLRGEYVNFRPQIPPSFNSSTCCLSQDCVMDAYQGDPLCLGFNTFFGSSAPVSGFIERTPYWKGQQ